MEGTVFHEKMMFNQGLAEQAPKLTAFGPK